MARAVLVLEIGVRWWVQPYLQTLAFVAHVTGCVPDEQKVAAFVVRHGFKLTVRPA